MKRAIVAMVLLISVAGMAQRGERGGQDLTAEQIATLHTKKMTLALDLSADQQAQIQALNLENAKMKLAKKEERKVAKDDGQRKKPTAEERFAMQNQRLDAQIPQKAEMKKILSAEQYSKWEKMAHHKGRHGKRKGKKGEGRSGHKKEGRK